ncbi:MAG: Phytochrome, two-component sensor histidine kinase [Myxococcaceae bacterium]|nr:Phytochrome, two-component sensor histidine kinase [Myxococcaceae bacterium]
MFSTPANPADKRTVWIVDDSALEAEMARKTLGSQFATRVFADGAALLEQIVAAPLPDVLVLDWVMPGVSGIEVCQFLRAREATSELKILLLTAQNQTGQIVAGLAAGANDYLSKPYSPAELLARVTALVRAKRLRERAEGAERSLRALLAHLPDALITTSATGEITFLNAEAERLLATSTAAVRGRHLGEFFPALAHFHVAPHESENFEALPELELGSRLFAPAVRRMLLDGLPTIALTLRDVTETRRLETRRLDFYSMVAHDLRSPLAAMTLRVGIMREEQYGPLAERYRNDLQLVEGRIGELVSLINDFLDIARSEGVGITLAPQLIDLTSLVRTNLSDFDDVADLRQVSIRFDAPETKVEALADPARLKQVVTNLISNAVKFSSKGGQVLVEVAARAQDVEFAVSDAGRGIAEDKISELFKRYSRPATDSALPGTGLGLMIVREIVAAHHGTCGVESTLGKGSRFWFRLPLPPAQAGASPSR